jgi:hypothetical protein
VLTKLFYFGLTFASGMSLSIDVFESHSCIVDAHSIANPWRGIRRDPSVRCETEQLSLPDRMFLSPRPSINFNASLQRRLISVLALSLGPTLWRSLITSLGRPSSATQDHPHTRRERLQRLLNSEWIRRLPEAWMIWFLVRGRNVDWSKSLFGMRYVRFFVSFSLGW